MTFTQAVRPFVEKKLELATKVMSKGNDAKGFALLEDAHVIGQQSTYYHTLVHIRMLQFGLKHRDWKEVFGQVLRIVGAITKTAIGLLPTGNTGGANVSPFKPMPISKDNEAILAKVKSK